MRKLICGVVAAAVVMVLAMPIHARQRNNGPGCGWVFRMKDRVVKIIQKTVATFGDGLSDPRPKP